MAKISAMHRFIFRNFMLIMVAILLGAAILRFPMLTIAPPGLHFDEAANGILASEIGWEGKRPLFISSYTGKEVLFFYLAGGLMRLIGTSTFALRLAAAFTGLLTIAATYWLGRELQQSRRVALLAALLLAISFWHLLFSRLGFRAITQPLLQAITVAALLRGIRYDDRKWLVASGVFLGLTAYTYLAARLFPVLLFFALLPLLLSRQQRAKRWYQLGLWALLAFIVLLPLLGYFWANPDAFWVRITQVAPSEGSGVVDSYIKSLGMFFWRGDPYERFNIPQRPLFTPFWSIFLLAGWFLCLWHWPKKAIQQTAVLLLLIAPLVMILPTALATGEIIPSNLRAIGLIPFIFYLPAIGFDAVLTAVEKISPRIPATALSFLLIFTLGLATTWNSYFNEWAKDTELFYESDGDLTAVASFLDQTDLTNKTIYVAALHYQHPTLAFLSKQYNQVKWLPNSSALPLSQSSSALYIYPHNSPAPLWAKPLLASPVTTTDHYEVYELTTPPELAIPNLTNANLGNAVTLLGYEMEATQSGDTLPLTLYWRIDGIPAADVKAFVHLEDRWGYRWSQTEPFAYPVAQWALNDVVVQQIEVPVPDGTPPGVFQLRVGLFDPANGNRLVRLDDAGRYAGDAFVIHGVGIEPGEPPQVLPVPPTALGLAVLPELELLGYERGKTAVSTGERVDLALWWHATAPLPPITTRLELVRSNQTGRILLNTQPVHGTYPFANWSTPQFVIDRQGEPIPDSFQTGEYMLQLRLLDEADNTLTKTNLGTLAITKAERLFNLPQIATPLDATFGNEIKLHGYDLTAADNTYELSLVWEALTEPAANYTVFVHVLAQEGTCCVWQQDIQPQQGQYPTTRWVANEIVIDDYAFELPPDLSAGDYIMEVGLYIAESGQRLQVAVPNQPVRDVVYLRPLTIE